MKVGSGNKNKGQKKSSREESWDPSQNKEADKELMKDLQDVKEILEKMDDYEVMKEEQSSSKASMSKRKKSEMDEESRMDGDKEEFLKYMKDNFVIKDPVSKKTKADVELQEFYKVLEGPEYQIFMEICQKMRMNTSE
ncbi:unnamed protein product [Allacma fusca]|uniref:Uncharacterized protein n=1 Tax=Allacma fusca TaxID=39272 RepID=A0A8J2K8U8_9HEXA|nr:unnamed protein product [Allacma fusca]